MGDSLYEFATSAKERIDNRITVICTRSRNLILLLRECKIEIEAKNGKTGLLAEWINEIIENVEKTEGDVTRVRQIHVNQYKNYMLLPAYLNFIENRITRYEAEHDYIKGELRTYGHTYVQ